MYFYFLQMIQMVQTEAVAQPTPTPVVLRLPGEYEVQVAAHLTLVHLEAFGQDMLRFLRGLAEQSDDDETES